MDARKLLPPGAARAARRAWRALPALRMLVAFVLALTQPGLGLADGGGAQAIDALQPGLAARVRQLVLDGNRREVGDGKRIDVDIGPLDARLRLAPCRRVDPYLPAGAALWGRTRIGLRCAQGVKAWNVYLPLTVSVFGPGWVAAAPLPAGMVVAAGDLIQAEVNLAEDAAEAVTDPSQAVGRTLARALNAGQAVRESHLKVRQWFAAGDEVRITARGNGYAVAGSGQALTNGLEGQTARIRVESGRVLVGMPVAERHVELPL